MKLKIQSNKVFILNYLETQILERHRQEKGGISTTIELSLGELVRQEMRSIALSSRKKLQETELLEQSIQRVFEQVQTRLRKHQVEFEFEAYQGSLLQTLQYPAKEIAELNQHYFARNKGSSLAAKRLPCQSSVPYQIIEVGEASMVRGLSFYPLLDEFELLLDIESQEYTIDGSWFPFVLMIQEISVVLNSDGSLFIVTRGFSGDLMLFILGRMLKLCNLIYVAPSTSAEQELED